MPTEINGAAEEVVGPIRDALKAAAIASPTFTGTPAAPTAAPGTNTTQLATTAFVAAAVAALLDSAPGTLDTLNELAAALGDDANFAATMTAALAGKLAIGGQWSSVLTDSTTARLLALTDAGAYIRLTNVAACDIEVPPQADVAWADNTEIQFRVANTGIPTITEGAGVTVNNKGAAASLEQHGTFALKRVAADVWDFI
jgi:hypothetical protein